MIKLADEAIRDARLLIAELDREIDKIAKGSPRCGEGAGRCIGEGWM